LCCHTPRNRVLQPAILIDRPLGPAQASRKRRVSSTGGNLKTARHPNNVPRGRACDPPGPTFDARPPNWRMTSPMPSSPQTVFFRIPAFRERSNETNFPGWDFWGSSLFSCCPQKGARAAQVKSHTHEIWLQRTYFQK